MLFGPTVFLQDVHAAIAGDAVTEMHDEIVLLQLQEAIDGPRFQPPPRQHRRRTLAME